MVNRSDHRRRRRQSLVVCGLCLLTSSALTFAQTPGLEPPTGSLTVLARTGGLASATGLYFGEGFGVPTISDSGRVAFVAALRAAPDAGEASAFALCEYADGELHVLAQLDAQGAIGRPAINDAGQLAYSRSVAGSDAIWLWNGDALELVADDSTPLPGAPGVTLSGLSLCSFAAFPRIAADGAVPFCASLDGVPAATDGALLEKRSGMLEVILRKGAPLPPLPSLTLSSIDRFSMSEYGQYALRVFANGPGVAANDEALVLVGNASGWEVVAREGSAVPGAPLGWDYDSFHRIVAVNAPGYVLFRCRIFSPEYVRDGIVGGLQGHYRLLAAPGFERAGSPGSFWISIDSQPVANDANVVAFAGSSESPGSLMRTGIWRGTGDDWELAVDFLAAPAPGDGVPGAFAGLAVEESVQLNELGQAAFHGVLAGPGIDASNREGIWMTLPQGELAQVARSGNLIEVEPGEFRIVHSLELNAGACGGEAAARAVNDQGHLVFVATFTDATQAVCLFDSGAQPAVSFARGDCNASAQVDVGDAIYELQWLFALGPSPVCAPACDTNADGSLDCADAVWLLSYLFALGAPPAPPFGVCGVETAAAVECVEFPACP